MDREFVYIPGKADGGCPSSIASILGPGPGKACTYTTPDEEGLWIPNVGRIAG